MLVFHISSQLSELKKKMSALFFQHHHTIPPPLMCIATIAAVTCVFASLTSSRLDATPTTSRLYIYTICVRE